MILEENYDLALELYQNVELEKGKVHIDLNGFIKNYYYEGWQGKKHKST